MVHFTGVELSFPKGLIRPVKLPRSSEAAAWESLQIYFTFLTCFGSGAFCILPLRLDCTRCIQTWTRTCISIVCCVKLSRDVYSFDILFLLRCRAVSGGHRRTSLNLSPFKPSRSDQFYLSIGLAECGWWGEGLMARMPG
mgnify:CR=1 FL=1